MCLTDSELRCPYTCKRHGVCNTCAKQWHGPCPVCRAPAPLKRWARHACDCHANGAYHFNLRPIHPRLRMPTIRFRINFKAKQPSPILVSVGGVTNVGPAAWGTIKPFVESLESLLVWDHSSSHGMSAFLTMPEYPPDVLGVLTGIVKQSVAFRGPATRHRRRM